MTQKNIRIAKRNARKALSTAKKCAYSDNISQQLINSAAYQRAQHIAVYLALPEEVNLNTFIDSAWQDDKSLYLPVVTAKDTAMAFAPYARDTALTQDAMRMTIPSAPKEEWIRADALDLVIVPLVAFDDDGNRIGMGGGFYDRTFAFRKTAEKPRLVGVAFDVQRVDETITPEPWDVALDTVIVSD